MVSILLTNTGSFANLLIVPALIILFAIPVGWIRFKIKLKRERRLESMSPDEQRAYLKTAQKNRDGRETARTLFAISLIMNPNATPPESHGSGGGSQGSR